MLTTHDYSNRRGVLVQLLPRVHALLTETAVKDTQAALTPPDNIILWRHRMNKELVDVRRRWLCAMDGETLTGVFFFHFDAAGAIVLDELRAAWDYRAKNALFTLFIDRFANDPVVKGAAAVFAGPGIKRETNQEILAAVGLETHFENGLEPLGAPAAAAAALKLRYVKP